MGPQEEDTIGKMFFSIAFFVLGVVLIYSSMSVHSGISAHQLIGDITQLIMVIAGSVCVVIGVVAFFHRDSFGTQ